MALGQNIHLWYNIQPIESGPTGTTQGNRITFAPLFSVINHLPFDLSLSMSVGSATSGWSLQGGVMKGRGKETLLWELTADMWYYLKFRER